MLRRIKSLIRGRSPVSYAEAVRVGAGAALGVAMCGALARGLVDGRLGGAPLLIAPIGASAVLVFALPASPLAQPRSVVLGNVVAALVGVACAATIGHPALAAAAAVGGALLAMALLGCLHPPGGAIALAAALAGSSGQPLGYAYALVPVGLCSALIVLAAALYGRLTGHAYPHRAPRRGSVHGTKDPPPAERVGYTLADLDRALAQYGDLLDVSPEDLDALFRQVERQTQARLHSRILCGEIMSRDVIAVDLRQTAESALARLQRHELRTAPVVDELRRVVGLVRRAELLAASGKLVEAVVDPVVPKVRPTTRVDALLPILSGGSAHEVMVVDDERRLVGVVTQTDLLAVLYRAHVVESVVAAEAA